MSAQAQFLRSLNGAELSVASSAVVEGPGGNPNAAGLDNEAVRMMRAGLAIATFNALENFIEKRSAELAATVSSGTVGPGDLDESSVLTAARQTVEVLAAKLRARHLEASDKIALAAESGRQLATITSGHLELSPLALGWSGSNLGADDYKAILKILSLAKYPGANDLDELGKRLLAYSADTTRRTSEEFKQLSESRHSAAHDPTTAFSLLVLRVLPKYARLAGMTFDIVASRLARLLRNASPDLLQVRSYASTNIDLLFIRDFENSTWKWLGKPGANSRKNFSTIELARAHVIAKAQASHAAIVILDQSGEPRDWHTTDL